MQKPFVYEGKEPYLFISYAHAISSRAMEIISLLSENGYRVWYDEGLIVGSRYDDLIADRIENCGAFLCLLTNEYGESDFCKWEFDFAIETLKKVCIPVYLDEIKNITLPPGMRMKLSNIHAVVCKDDDEVILSSLRRSGSASVCMEEVKISAESGEDLSELQTVYDRKYKKLPIVKATEEDVKWFLMAAEKGLADAQFFLGNIYRYGIKGIVKDDKEAVKWFRESAKQGNASGQNSLGWSYQNGLGVAQSYEEAVKWYRKSAEQGNTVAQNNLGYMYEHGIGVPQNIEKAIKLYKLAADQGNENAKKALKNLQ